MRFLRAEFQVITPLLHKDRFISGHYFYRYLNHRTNALGIIVDAAKWADTDKNDFFAPYALPARFHYEYYNGLSRVIPHTSLYFKPRKIFTVENVLLLDILNPITDQVEDFKKAIQQNLEFQFGGKESDCNGLCKYLAANIYEYTPPNPPSDEIIIEFMSDFIPRNNNASQDFSQLFRSQMPSLLPYDYQLIPKSFPEFEEKTYHIKDDLKFQVFPQFFMMHFQTNYPEYNKNIAEIGLNGVGKLRSAGLGKFRLRNPEVSPIYHHGTYSPPIIDFTDEEKQFLKAVLLHDLVPKVGGIDLLKDYYKATPTLCGLLLKLHYEWHDLREKTEIRLTEFLRRIEKRHDTRVAGYYYKLALADQLAARMTRVKRVPTFSRYLIGHDFTQRIDLDGVTQSLLTIGSPFKLWKTILKSPDLALLNESLTYGDQPLSTHLLLALAFGGFLVRNKPAYVIAKVVPTREKQFLQGFWYKVFNITENKEVFIYVIEEKIPVYPAALVKKVLVKSIRPETSWLRIQ
jgi:hypothetical protein